MAAVTGKPGVEVCVWLPKDTNGNYTNSYNGAQESPNGGRVGHVALKIFPTMALKGTYAALILDGKDHVYISLWPGHFVKSHDIDVSPNRENGLPNAIIRLNKLDIAKMLKAFSDVIDTATWTLKSKVGSPLNAPQSCAGFVYKLLETGGIFTINGGVARYAGPRDWKFYSQTNSHLGDIMGGLFNSLWWRAWAVSPKLVLHVAASAAEGDKTDKQDTIALMTSSQVEQAPASNLGRNVAITGLGVAALGAGVVATKLAK